jgi:hypothetical protein
MTPTRSLSAAIALAAALVSAGASHAQEGESLLPVYAIVDESVQLESGQRDVSSYEDVEYARNVKDCMKSVEGRIDAWLKAKKLVPSTRRAQASRLRLEIELKSPKAGTLVIDYAWVPSRRRAFLDLRFLSGERLSVAEREHLVFGLELLDLRSELAVSMKCR